MGWNKYKNNIITAEASKCLLCYNATCTKACKKGLDPARFIRSVRFENAKEGIKYIDKSICSSCDGDCEKSCIHYDGPIRIKEMIENESIETNDISNVDLSVSFANVKCENPFFLSSSVVASNYEMCAKALDEGWAGIVFKTIGFLKPKEVSPRFDITSKEGTPFIGFRNLEQIAEHDLKDNLADLKKLKENYPTKIIVASIMGQNEEEWTELAKLVTEAKVDIIECNFSCPHMSGNGLGSDVGQNPDVVKKYTIATVKGTNLPVIAKMTPNITHMEIPARAAIEGGATGIAAINTIKSISGIDSNTSLPNQDILGKTSVSGYSGKACKPIALRFIHDLAKDEITSKYPISGMGGIETWHDALEFLLLGCENLQITTSVMQYGYRIIDDLISGLKNYMVDNGYKSLNDFIGKALNSFVPATSLNRDTVVFPLIDKDKCVKCGRCFISCSDAGHQALSFDEETREIKLNGSKCVGCHLCSLVCPANAISKAKRINKLKQ